MGITIDIKSVKISKTTDGRYPSNKCMRIISREKGRRCKKIQKLGLISIEYN
jgi:hypothetical protein